MFRDNYTNFTFDDLQSENFKVWITNKKDLKRNMSPNFSDKFNTPTYGQIRYHEGTTIDKQDFKLSCVAVDITLTEWRAITEWLSPLKSAKLTFDWNDKYYYMVKVSKAISGTMFMKRHVDPTLGQLYIITFDVEFTTVSDWAAMGPYCELSNSEFPNISIFNNSYYIPQIIIRDKVSTPETMTAQQSIYGGGYVDLCFNTEDFENPVVNDTNTITTYHTFAIKEIIDGELETIAKLKAIEENGELRCTYFYWDQATAATTWSYNLDKIIINSDIYFRLYLTNRQVVTQETSGTLSYKRYVADNILFANPGTYDMFPMMYLTGANSLVSEGQNYLSYTLNSAAYGTSNTAVVLDNKNMTVTNSGKSIVDTTDQYGNPVFLNIEHNKQVAISSGRPELIKAAFKEVTKTTDLIKTTTFTFIVDDKPIYNRYKPFLLHIFRNNFSNQVNVYNKDDYSSKQYYRSLYNVDNSKSNLNEIYTYKDNRYIFDTPNIQWTKIDTGWELSITFFSEAPNDLKLSTSVPNPLEPTKDVNHTMCYAKNDMSLVTLNESSIYKKGDVVYISLCDYEAFDLTTDEDSEFSIGCYTRDVI